MKFGLVSLATLACIGLGACSEPDRPAKVTTDDTKPAPMALMRKPAPKNAAVYFISPVNGAIVSNPVKVEFGLKGMGVAPAGVDQPDTGHHHLLIDTSLKDYGVPIQKDDRHLHFGGGETQTKLNLPPGEHTLQLVLGDHLHIPHDPPLVSEQIRISVSE